MPNGVFFINELMTIAINAKKPKNFGFAYHGRVFEFQTNKPVVAQMWVMCLNFLKDHAMSVIGWQDKMKPELYFTNY